MKLNQQRNPSFSTQARTSARTSVPPRSGKLSRALVLLTFGKWKLDLLDLVVEKRYIGARLFDRYYSEQVKETFKCAVVEWEELNVAGMVLCRIDPEKDCSLIFQPVTSYDSDTGVVRYFINVSDKTSPHAILFTYELLFDDRRKKIESFSHTYRSFGPE